jgi:uncharacterized protein (DUF2345 family)
MYTIFLDDDIKSETKGMYSVKAGSISYDGFKTYAEAEEFAEKHFNNNEAY